MTIIFLESSIETTMANCNHIINISQMMLKNMKEREVNTRDWQNFVQKDGYIVASANKIFDILSDITKNKEQSSLDSFPMNKGNYQ